MTIDQAVAKIPEGWAFEIRSYDDGSYLCELWRFADTPLAETGAPIVRVVRQNLALAISVAGRMAARGEFRKAA